MGLGYLARISAGSFDEAERPTAPMEVPREAAAEIASDDAFWRRHAALGYTAVDDEVAKSVAEARKQKEREDLAELLAALELDEADPLGPTTQHPTLVVSTEPLKQRVFSPTYNENADYNNEYGPSSALYFAPKAMIQNWQPAKTVEQLAAYYERVDAANARAK